MDAPILRMLLAGSIDYAGLFPPAGLGMAEAAAGYARYRAGPDAWALGRFVVPASRLGELGTAADALAPRRPAEPWRVSALLGAAAGEDVEAIGEFNCRHAAGGAPALVVDAAEAKAASPDAVDSLLAAMPTWLRVYVEIPLDQDPAPLVRAIARRGGRAKMRTGGVTTDGFPTPAEVLRFLTACVDEGVVFKATAGLHHPLRAEYRLTYAPDSPQGTMFGYLNVFLAAAFLLAGLSGSEALALLTERETDAFALAPDAISWRGHRLDRAAVERARASGIVGFGSCSFTEPLDELRTLAWSRA